MRQQTERAWAGLDEAIEGPPELAEVDAAVSAQFEGSKEAPHVALAVAPAQARVDPHEDRGGLVERQGAGAVGVQLPEDLLDQGGRGGGGGGGGGKGGAGRLEKAELGAVLGQAFLVQVHVQQAL